MKEKIANIYLMKVLYFFLNEFIEVKAEASTYCQLNYI